MKNARLVVFGVAVTAGLGAAYLFMGRKPPPPPVRIVTTAPVESESLLVAAHDLAFGAVLQPPDLRWQPWPKAQVPANTLTKTAHPNGIDEIKGSIVRSNFLSNEPIRPERLVRPGGSGFMAAVLSSGMRAIAINIDEKGTTSAGGFILPNDHVDVVRTFHAEDSPPGSFASETILTNVRVLAIGANIQEKAGERVITGNTATLELSPEQAERVILAQRNSQLSLALRSIADAANPDVPPPPPPPGLTIVRFGNTSQERVR